MSKQTLAGAFAALLCQKCVSDPVDAGPRAVHVQHGENVEPNPKVGEVASLLKQLASGPDEALLLAGIDAGGGSPVAITRASADLSDYEDVAVAGDDIQLTQAAEVITLENLETLVAEEISRDVFSPLANELLLRPAAGWFS